LLLRINGELKIGVFGWDMDVPGNIFRDLVLFAARDDGGEHTMKVDYWAPGVLTYEFLSGSLHLFIVPACHVQGVVTC
jgi:aurora kinase, other